MKFMIKMNYEKMLVDIKQNYNNYGLYDAWTKKIKYIQCSILIIAIILALYTQCFYRKNILIAFKVEKLGATEGIILALVCIALIIIVNIILIVLHELIHVISYPDFSKKAVIVFSYPIAISAAYDGWQTKKSKLLSIMLPFCILSIIILVLLLFTHEYLIVVWLLFFNIALSISDIFAFFYIIKNVPKDALMYENYYRYQ